MTKRLFEMLLLGTSFEEAELAKLLKPRLSAPHRACSTADKLHLLKLPRLEASVLMRLAGDPSDEVRTAVLGHPKCTDDVRARCRKGLGYVVIAGRDRAAYRDLNEIVCLTNATVVETAEGLPKDETVYRIEFDGALILVHTWY